MGSSLIMQTKKLYFVTVINNGASQYAPALIWQRRVYIAFPKTAQTIKAGEVYSPKRG